MTWFGLSKRVFNGVHAILRTRSACFDKFTTNLDDLMIQWLPPEMEPANSKLEPCCCRHLSDQVLRKDLPKFHAGSWTPEVSSSLRQWKDGSQHADLGSFPAQWQLPCRASLLLPSGEGLHSLCASPLS